MTIPRRHALPALLALPLALSACGGKSDKDKITSIVKDGGKDPVTVCDHASKAFLAQVGGDKAACVKAAKADPSGKDPNVKIDSIKISGDSATAAITGNQGHQTISFVKESGDWKVAGVK